ncbi:trichohyalin-like isoform X2 [Haliotis asinina]|uniref:trichohyalin-like isoform X2 n=1 Tax=Haliotis asinina TaxID=109174 RepID=UPI00353279EC
MLPSMISMYLLLLVTLTSVIDESLAVEEDTVQQPAVYIDVEISRKPLAQEWPEEMCPGGLDVNGCIDKADAKTIEKIQNKAWKNEVKAKWRAKKTKWQQRIDKLRKMIREKQSQKKRPKKTKDLTKEKRKKTTLAWKMLQKILKGKKSIAQVKKTIGKQKLKQMKSETKKGKRWARRMLLALLEGRKTTSQVREIIEKQKLEKLQSEDGEEGNEEKTVEEADQLEKLEEEECKGVRDSEGCKREMAKINDGEKTTWAWKMLQAILKGKKSIAQVKKSIGKEKLKQMKSEKRKGKRWAWRMLLALLEGRKTISQVREAIIKQKIKKLQSEDGEEGNEEKIVEEADQLEKLEEEECKDVADSEVCKKEMAEINDGKKTTWAWKMLQAILKGRKSIAQVKKTIGKQKLKQMQSKKGKKKGWAWRMLLALLEGRKTISEVREAIKKQKLKKLQSEDGEEVNEEKTVEEADQLEKLEEEECKGVVDSEACKKEMAEINDGKKTTWAWKMLETILKGGKSIAEVKETIGKQKLKQMKAKRGTKKRWAWRMLLALLEERKTISEVREELGEQKLKKLQSQNDEEINEEKTVEEADQLEKLEEEECKGVEDSEACKKEMAEINDGKKTTWAWKMLQTILKGGKSIAEVKETIGKQKLKQMKAKRGTKKRWAWRMLLALLEERKTISEVREELGEQKLKKLQSQNDEVINEEKTVEEADQLEKLEEEECKGVEDSEACKKEMAEINVGKKTTWAWKMLQTILKGGKSIAEVKETIGKQKLKQMKAKRGTKKRWAWRMLLALLEERKTISEVREELGEQKLKKLQSGDGEEVNEEKTVEEADHLEKLEEEECKDVADSEGCRKEMENINDGKKTTWAWKMLQVILKGKKSIAQVKKTIGKEKLRQMKSERRGDNRWDSRLLLELLERTKTIPEVREAIKKQKVIEEKAEEEAGLLAKLQEEECKGVTDSEVCKKEMKEIKGDKKTTWAWKVLQTIMKGKKSIAQVKKTIGKQKLKQMQSKKGKKKGWAWRMLLALLEERKTISEVREIIKKQKLKKLQSEDGEEVNEEKIVEEADQLEKLEEEECKDVADSEVCKKEMENINDGKKTTWAWKMLQVILKGKKSIAQVKKTIGKEKLRQMKSERRGDNRWDSRLLLELLERTKTIPEVREAIKKQKVIEEKAEEEAGLLAKLQEEECKGVTDSEVCKKEMKEIKGDKKTTWAWKVLQTIMKGKKSIAQVKKTIGKQKLKQMQSKKGKKKGWAWRMLLALLEGRKTISEVREAIKKQKLKKLQSEDGEEVNEEKTVEEADQLEKLEEEECKGVVDSEACEKEMAEINDGKKTTWAWKMLQTILKGRKSIAEVKETIGKQKLKQMKAKRGTKKTWAWRMLLALLEERKTISEVREIIKKQKLKKLQSEDGEEVNEEKIVEEADQLEKLEEEECKDVADSEVCKKEMENINDGKKTTWAWKMLQVILKGKKSIAQVKKTIGKEKLRQMKSERRGDNRWDSRLLLELLERTKTIPEVREAIKKQKVIEEKAEEEAGLLAKLQEEECKGVTDSEVCKKEMKEIKGDKKTTWAWKVLQTIMKGKKSIAQVKKTIGKQKLKQMQSKKGKKKGWAWRMLLALLEERKTISQVREAIIKQKIKKLQSEDGEEGNEEKIVEEADQLEKLEEEECKDVADSEVCKKEMENINDGKKTTWAWKMLQVILKGKKSIAQVKKTIGKEKLRQMKSERRGDNRWDSRLLLELLERTKTIPEVREAIKKQKVIEEKAEEEAGLLAKLQEEECKGVTDSEVCKKEMKEIKGDKKTTWAWKVLQTIVKGKKSIAQVKKTIGKQKLKQMQSKKGKKKGWAWRMLLALLEGRKTISEVREAIKKQKLKKLQSEDGEEVNEEKTVEEADQLEKLEEEECKGVVDSEACKKEMAEINDGKKTTWAWKMLQTILKGRKSIAEVKETIGKQKLKQMKSDKGRKKRWSWRMLLALLDGTKTVSQVRKLKVLSEPGAEIGEECEGSSNVDACVEKSKTPKNSRKKKPSSKWNIFRKIVNALGGNRKNSAQGNRKNSVDGDKTNSAQTNGKISTEGNRENSTQGNREKPVQRNRNNSAEGNRQNSAGGKGKNSARGKGKN